jgi:hypothetical protein
LQRGLRACAAETAACQEHSYGYKMLRSPRKKLDDKNFSKNSFAEFLRRSHGTVHTLG